MESFRINQKIQDFHSKVYQALRMSSKNGHAEVVKALLSDKRVDPSARDQEALRMSSKNGHAAVVKILLTYKRLNPSARNQEAIRWASNMARLKWSRFSWPTEE